MLCTPTYLHAPHSTRLSASDHYCIHISHDVHLHVGLYMYLCMSFSHFCKYKLLVLWTSVCTYWSFHSPSPPIAMLRTGASWWETTDGAWSNTANKVSSGTDRRFQGTIACELLYYGTCICVSKCMDYFEDIVSHSYCSYLHLYKICTKQILVATILSPLNL